MTILISYSVFSMFVSAGHLLQMINKGDFRGYRGVRMLLNGTLAFLVFVVLWPAMLGSTIAKE